MFAAPHPEIIGTRKGIGGHHLPADPRLMHSVKEPQFPATVFDGWLSLAATSSSLLVMGAFNIRCRASSV